jgi:hypothetical protein
MHIAYEMQGIRTLQWKCSQNYKLETLRKMSSCYGQVIGFHWRTWYQYLPTATFSLTRNVWTWEKEKRKTKNTSCGTAQIHFPLTSHLTIRPFTYPSTPSPIQPFLCQFIHPTIRQHKPATAHGHTPVELSNSHPIVIFSLILKSEGGERTVSTNFW